MTKEKPKVYIERVAKLNREGIKAVCGTEEEYSDYVKKMTKETLADKIAYHGKVGFFIPEEDAKEHIQNAQKRLGNLIKRPKENNCMSVEKILKEIDKIFKEEFGEELL